MNHTPQRITKQNAETGDFLPALAATRGDTTLDRENARAAALAQLRPHYPAGVIDKVDAALAAGESEETEELEKRAKTIEAFRGSATRAVLQKADIGTKELGHAAKTHEQEDYLAIVRGFRDPREVAIRKAEGRAYDR